MLTSHSLAVSLMVLVSGLHKFPPVTSVLSSYNLCDPPKPNFDLKGDLFPNVGDTSRLFVNLTGRGPEDENRGCWMRFVTCNSCKFRVEPMTRFTYQNCLWTPMFNNDKNKCAPGCTFVHFFDPDYRNETASSFTTDGFTYNTLSKTLYVYMCSNRSGVKDIQFSLNLTVVAKKQMIRGSSYDVGALHRRYIMSPAFPNYYAENNEIYEYQFQAVNYDEFVELTFDDWNLSPKSILWFNLSDHDGPIYGSSHRPVVLSNYNQLILRFQAGGPSSSSIRNFMGFKATYRFRSVSDRTRIRKAITDCGGYDMNRVGGLVTFDPKMSTNEYYDCIWVLKRHPDYTMIYAKLIEFDSSPRHYVDEPDRVEIRGGLTSLGSYKAEVTYDNVDDYKLYGFDNDTGFYIRLQGRYHNARDFVLAFASYKYGNCRYHEFKCYNSRCISVSLKCDGYDHCGDNSDERQSICGTDSTDYSGYSYTISIGVIIPMAISIFLIVVICLLIIFIRRCRTLSQQNPRNGRQPITSVSGNMARRNRRGRNRSRIQMNLTIQQDAPPTYDEVIQNTPIGYLNMAFMWSQPEVNNGMINPPTYEEATSPTTELPRLTSSQNMLNQSTESSSSGDSLDSHPCTLPRASDTSSEGSLLEEHPHRPDSQSSYSSDSMSSEGNRYHDNDSSQGPQPGHADQNHQQMQRQRKIVQDDFIECPVSSSTLRKKEETTPGDGQTARGKEFGAVACPDQMGGHSSSPSHSNEDHSSTRGRDREKKKKKSPIRSRPDHAVGDSEYHERQNRTPSHGEQELGRSGGPSRDSPAEHGGDVVIRNPSPRHSQRPPTQRYAGISDSSLPLEAEIDSSGDRLHGNYLSLSRDNEEENSDFYV